MSQAGDLPRRALNLLLSGTRNGDVHHISELRKPVETPRVDLPSGGQRESMVLPESNGDNSRRRERWDWEEIILGMRSWAQSGSKLAIHLGAWIVNRRGTELLSAG